MFQIEDPENLGNKYLQPLFEIPTSRAKPSLNRDLGLSGKLAKIIRFSWMPVFRSENLGSG